jgi:glutamate carboxypeptidase
MPAAPNVDQVVQDIIRWASIESPTYDAAAVNRMLDEGARDLAAMGFRIERQAGTLGFGDVVIGRLDGAEPGPGLLILAHVDTVHAVGTLAGPLPIRIEGDRLYGPGVTDMKGGTVLTLHVLGQLIAAQGGRLKRTVTVVLIPDEEVGSPSSRATIEAEAKKHAHVLVPEPGRDHVCVTGRHAVLRYNIHVHGQPSHAGAAIRRGVSSIRAMARLIETMEDWSDYERGQTFAVGRVNSGTWVNVVPVLCSAEVLCVAATPEDVLDIDERLRTMRAPFPGTRITVEAGPVRPLYMANAGTMALYDKAKAIADANGWPFDHMQSGGGSDGNFTGALGVPTLDGLGVWGGGIHTKEEFCDIRSITPRGTILAGLIADLAG